MDPNPKRLLIVDDDPIHSRALNRSLRLRRFEVASVRDPEAAIAAAAVSPPDYVIIEQQFGVASGLALIGRLKAISPGVRVLVLTRYASIERAIDAIKLGACHYLAKPAYAEEILAGFGLDARPAPAAPDKPHDLEECGWRHIVRTLADCRGNVSAAARALKMHRKTLQRKLLRHAGGDGVVAGIRARLSHRPRRTALAA